MNKMNPVVHFEMPAEDKKRMSDFYTNVFGWQSQFLGPDMGNYVLVNTTETDNKGCPKNAGAINGGFYSKKDDPNAPHPSVVIAVDDINDSSKKIVVSGGKLLGEPMPIPGIGSYLAFIDTEGNRVGMLQPTQNM